ncbi:MAG TPA: 2-dehydro-3-deoxygalactonokinase [Casimicrobiaceae bacterium]|nr:2-dehydro-3-deoxygalactonokinase [Casimicrobiaceae bacterium]
MADVALIAIDWGTTAARAYAVDRHDGILASRSAPLGVQQLASGGYAIALEALLGDWMALRVPRIAAGMIGSRQGWIEAPYLPCPATFESMASHIVETPSRELAIVPGLITHDESGVPDVMRGEEAQLAGAFDDNARALAVLPGTHSKWAMVERGKVVEFASYMTGELYAVLLAHSILGRLAHSSETAAAPNAAFEAGIARGLVEGGLAHRVFAARTLALTGSIDGRDVPDYLSGVLIGDEIASARAWAARRGHDSSHVHVIGADALVDRYIAALGSAGIDAGRGPSDAAVRGITRMARLSGRIE